MKILEIRNLQKRYKDFHLKVDLTLNKEETLGFVGPNGAGKTTTINLLLNIVKKDDGDIKIFGLDHIKNEAEIKERIGFVFEEQNFYRNMKIDHIIKFCASLYGRWKKEYCLSALERFNLPGQKKYGELSKGMKTKLAFLIALSSGGEFLILDEPTSGLDPKVRHELLAEIEEMKKIGSLTILFSSHLISDVERVADRVALINNGRIILMETKSELKEKWKKIILTDENIDNIHVTGNILRLRKDDLSRYHIITKNFNRELIADLESAGARIVKIEEVSLEEIFIECVS
jgi:ABC-2 type transport system ATP-binding protein